MKLLQGVQAVLETPPPLSFTILHLCLALLHFSGSTTKASLSEGTLISSVPRIGFVWEWNCQEDFARTSRFLSLKRLSLELTSVSLGVQTLGRSNIHDSNIVCCLFRTKLVPYDPTTRTTTVRNAKVPQADSDYSSEYDRMTTSSEEEFIQNGPMHLLEAVYCDPCKAKVMDMCQIYIHA